MPDSDREVGIVKFYNPRKGYGFITRADGTDVFFHLSHFRTMQTPSAGNAVRFALGQNREGLTAEDIVIIPISELERFGGVITWLDAESAEVTTPDDFRILFKRADFIPHTRADSLREGDEVEMYFLLQEDDSDTWRASVVRAIDFDPDQLAVRRERREGDDDEENRRLLGILYKTDLDEEARHAGGLLVERNMRASLSALASRVFDRRLDSETRREIVDWVPRLYFDDECQSFLTDMAARLREAVLEEDDESSPGAGAALRLLLDDDRFPVRWSQYLLPFGLTLLRSLAAVPSCHAVLEDESTEEPADLWLTRVCRHVEQRRSGHGYVMTTALSTFDALWQRQALCRPLSRALARLLASCDAEALANQIYHLRDKLSPEFLPVLLPRLGEHPDLGAALAAPAQREIFSSWLEALLRADGEIPVELLAGLMPILDELRRQISDEEALSRLMRPVTENLTPTEIVRMLTAEDLPERSVWACLRHLEREGELEALLAIPETRGQVVAWLRRTSEKPRQRETSEGEITTALRLVDSLRVSPELAGELTEIGTSLFSGLAERFEAAEHGELKRLLEEFDLGSLPGLLPVLCRRLGEADLPDAVRARIIAYFQDYGVVEGELAAAYAGWSRQPDDAVGLGALLAACERAEHEPGEPATMAAEVRERLAGERIGWHDGFITAIVPAGDDQAAQLEGFALVAPRRLFPDPADFAVNRYVRLLHRRGVALGVVACQPSERGTVSIGRLDGPLGIDHRNAMVGTLLDAGGETAFFEVAEFDGELDELIRPGAAFAYDRVAAAAGATHRFIAYRLRPVTDDQLATGLRGDDLAVAVACARAVPALPTTSAAGAAWGSLAGPRRAAILEALTDGERSALCERVEAS